VGVHTIISKRKSDLLLRSFSDRFASLANILRTGDNICVAALVDIAPVLGDSRLIPVKLIWLSGRSCSPGSYRKTWNAPCRTEMVAAAHGALWVASNSHRHIRNASMAVEASFKGLHFRDSHPPRNWCRRHTTTARFISSLCVLHVGYRAKQSCSSPVQVKRRSVRFAPAYRVSRRFQRNASSTRFLALLRSRTVQLPMSLK